MPIYKRRSGARPVLNRDPKGLLDKSYPTATLNLLRRVDDWDFNIFALDRFTSGQPLLNLGLKVFQQHNLIKTFNLDIVKLIKTLRSIEETYHARNPYHNAIHAADVTQAVHCYIRDRALRPLLEPFDSLCCLLAAMCHDSDHPGVNQAFLEKTDNYLVKFYNSKSVLENHHWHVAFSIFCDSQLFSHFTKVRWENVKKYIQNLILATDISQQTNYLTRFVNLVEQKNLDVQHNDEHRLLMLQMALKCADICNPCRVWSVCCSWANLVCEEFFRQGDRERHLGFPVGVLNDRYNTTPVKIQIGFIEFLVKPLFRQWHNFVGSKISQRMCDLIESNLTKWKSKIPKDNDNKNNSAMGLVASNVPAIEFSEVSGPSGEKVIEKHVSLETIISRSDDVSEAGDELGLLLESSRLINRRHSFPVIEDRDQMESLLTEALSKSYQQSCMLQNLLHANIDSNPKLRKDSTRRNSVPINFIMNSDQTDQSNQPGTSSDTWQLPLHCEVDEEFESDAALLEASFNFVRQRSISIDYDKIPYETGGLCSEWMLVKDSSYLS